MLLYILQENNLWYSSSTQKLSHPIKQNLRFGSILGLSYRAVSILIGRFDKRVNARYIYIY